MAEDRKSVKLAILGESGAGKTSILNRFIVGGFDPDQQSTVAANYMSKDITIRNQCMNLVFWDVSGKDQYKAVTQLYCKNVDGFIVVCDCTQKHPVKYLQKWIEAYISDTKRNDSQVFVVANKIDLIGGEHEERIKQVENFAEENGYLAFQVSAKTGDMIEEMFADIEKYLLKHCDSLKRKSVNLFRAKPPNTVKKGKCC